MVYFPNSCECRCAACHVSLKEGLAISFVAFLILGVSVGAALGTHSLSHWTLKSSLLLGGAITVGGCAVEAALFAIFKQKKEKSETRLSEPRPKPNLATSEEEIPKKVTFGSITIENVTPIFICGAHRKIFKVEEANCQEVYYIKMGGCETHHKAGEKHPLNDWLSYKISKFYMDVDCIPKIWQFDDLRDLENSISSKEFSSSFKRAVLAHKEIRNISGPFVIQLGIEMATLPKSGLGQINYFEQVEIDKISLQNALLFSVLIGHGNLMWRDAPLDENKKIQLIDNADIGHKMTSLENWTFWITQNPTVNEEFDESVKAKFLRIDKDVLQRNLKSVIDLWNIDPQIIPNILHNLEVLQSTLKKVNTPGHFIDRYGKG